MLNSREFREFDEHSQFDEHSHSLPLLRDWLNDVTAGPPTSSHSTSRNSRKKRIDEKTVIISSERPKTTTSSSSLIHGQISFRGLQHHPFMEKLLPYSNVHEELTRQAAFHCPALANLLYRSWIGLTTIATDAVTKLHEAETITTWNDSMYEMLMQELSINLDGIVLERNNLRIENIRLLGECDDHEIDAIRHRKELTLALMDADTAYVRLEKVNAAALSGTAQIHSKAITKGMSDTSCEVEKYREDEDLKVNDVASRGVIDLTLLLSELEKERARQVALADELKAFVGSSALTIMLQNQWWLPRPSRSIGVQWVENEPPLPLPLPSVRTPVIDKGPYVLAIQAKKRPHYVDLPFEIRILLKTFSFTNGPRLVGLGQAKRLLLQLLLDKASVDKAALPLQGMRVSLASCMVEYFSQKFGLAQLSDLRVIEIVIAVRAHAHHQSQFRTLGAAMSGVTTSLHLLNSSFGSTMPMQSTSDRSTIVPLQARGGGAPDLLMRISDLFLGATSIRQDGRPWLQQGPLDAIVIFLDELRTAKELVRDRVTGTGDITPGELEGIFPVSRYASLSAAKVALSPFLSSEYNASSDNNESQSQSALVESMLQISTYSESGNVEKDILAAFDSSGGLSSSPTPAFKTLESTSVASSFSSHQVTLPVFVSSEPQVMEERIDLSLGMRVVILHWTLEQSDWEVRICSAFDDFSMRGLPYTSERSKEMSKTSTQLDDQGISEASINHISENTLEKVISSSSSSIPLSSSSTSLSSLLIQNQSRYSTPFVRLPPPSLKSKRSTAALHGSRSLPSDNLWQPPASLYKSSKKSGALDYSLEKKRESEGIEKRRKSVDFLDTISLATVIVGGTTSMLLPTTLTLRSGDGLSTTLSQQQQQQQQQQNNQSRFLSSPVFRPEDLFVIDVDAFADARHTRIGTATTKTESSTEPSVDAFFVNDTHNDGIEDETIASPSVTVSGNQITESDVIKKVTDESTALDIAFLHHAYSVIESPVPSSQLLSSQALRAIANALETDDDNETTHYDEASSLARGTQKEEKEEFYSKQRDEKYGHSHHHHQTTAELLNSSAVIGRLRRAKVYANRRRHSVPVRATVPAPSLHPNSNRSQGSSGFSANESNSSSTWPSGVAGAAGVSLMRRRSSASSMTGITADGDTIVEEEGDSRSSQSSTDSRGVEKSGVLMSTTSASSSALMLPRRPLMLFSNTTQTSLHLRSKGLFSRKETKSYAISDLTALAKRLSSVQSVQASSTRSRKQISLSLATNVLTTRDPSIDTVTVAKAFEHARWRLEEAAHNVKISGWVRTILPLDAYDELHNSSSIKSLGGNRPKSPLNSRKVNGMHSSLPINRPGSSTGGKRHHQFYWRNPRTGQVSLTCPEIERDRVTNLDYTSFAEMCLRHGFLRNCESVMYERERDFRHVSSSFSSPSSSKARSRLTLMEHKNAVRTIQSWWRWWSWIRNQPTRAKDKTEKTANEARLEAERLTREAEQAEQALLLATEAEQLQKKQQEENGISLSETLVQSVVSNERSNDSSQINLNSAGSGSGVVGSNGRRGSVEQMISNARMRIAQRDAARKHDEAVRAEAIAALAIEEATIARANSLRVDEVRSLLHQSKRNVQSIESLSLDLESATSVALRALRQFGKRFSFSKPLAPAPPYLSNDSITHNKASFTSSLAVLGEVSALHTPTRVEKGLVRNTSSTTSARPGTADTVNIDVVSRRSSARPGTAETVNVDAVSRRENSNLCDDVVVPSSSTFLSELSKLEAQEAWWDALTPRSRTRILQQVKVKTR